ncbi:MAG: SDR family NAD(P)-dependent oxidoreductase [Calditrichia bacterium]
MEKTILVTGSTDGIGRLAAELLLEEGQQVILHGRNSAKLEATRRDLLKRFPTGKVESVQADLADFSELRKLINMIKENFRRLDVLMNNAGVFKTASIVTAAGLDVRFMVNNIAPYYLTRQLLEKIPPNGRIVNVASAAQAPVDLKVLAGKRRAEDFEAYAQSKLAMIMWTNFLAQRYRDTARVFVAVNPGSLLGTKMVREGFGMSGKDVGIGGEILVRAALGDEFADANGKYYDNDGKRFAPPHPDALDLEKINAVVKSMEEILSDLH